MSKYGVKKYVIMYFSGICLYRYISNSNTILALNSAYAHRKQQCAHTVLSNI